MTAIPPILLRSTERVVTEFEGPDLEPGHARRACQPAPPGPDDDPYDPGVLGRTCRSAQRVERRRGTISQVRSTSIQSDGI